MAEYILKNNYDTCRVCVHDVLICHTNINLKIIFF